LCITRSCSQFQFDVQSIKSSHVISKCRHQLNCSYTMKHFWAFKYQREVVKCSVEVIYIKKSNHALIAGIGMTYMTSKYLQDLEVFKEIVIQMFFCYPNPMLQTKVGFFFVYHNFSTFFLINLYIVLVCRCWFADKFISQVKPTNLSYIYVNFLPMTLQFACVEAQSYIRINY
jgi:hypothetical protein